MEMFLKSQKWTNSRDKNVLNAMRDGESEQESKRIRHTWKKPGGMGPPGMASFGGMLPITGLGAAAALWKTPPSLRICLSISASDS